MNGLNRFLTRRNALLVLAGVLFLTAWNRELNLLYGVFALVCATVLVAVSLPRFALNGIEVTRTLPEAAFEGQEVEVRVVMTNQGRTTRFMVEALDANPAAAPQEREPLVFAGQVRGRGQRHFTYRLTCYKRGLYPIGPLRLRSAYPMGIAWSERMGDPSLPTLLVYPSVFKIASFPLVASGTLVSHGMENLAKAGGSDDFFGTREYRQGDSLRHIHWPSSARNGQLIVKEFEVLASTETTLLMDLYQASDIGEERESTLEYAVRIAASIASYALERRHTVQLVGFASTTHIVPSGKGLHHLALVLDQLARVKGDGRIPYPKAISRAADWMRDGSTAVLFLHGGESLEDFLDSLALLHAKRVRLVVIYLEGASFRGEPSFVRSSEKSLAQELFARGAKVYFVERGMDLTELFT